MMTASKRALSVIALFALIAAAPAFATLIVPLSQEDLVTGADVVVQGRILETRSFWNQEHTVIFTDVRIQVEDPVLGHPSSVVTVRTVGGQVGKERLVFVGGPSFTVGERQLLFLHHHQDGSLRVVGARQGQFRIVNQGGIETAVSMLAEGPALVTPDGDETERPRAVPAAELKHQVRDLASRIGHPNAQ